MIALSFQSLLARPRWGVAARSRRPAIVTRVTRRLSLVRGPVPPGCHTYPDLFFADPVAVEDDSRRMRHAGRRL